ncbi:MAG: acyl-CoA dehydrogenase family protein [Gammaproteobacteria bacterium]
MHDYRAPVETLLWTLRHGAGAERLDGWDDELAGEVVAQAARFIEREVAPLDPLGDAQPARLVEGRVRVPEPFVAAYRRYAAEGWPGICAPPEYGGQGLPHALGGTVSEMLAGACISFQMVLTLAQSAMRTLLAHGSEAQRRTYLPRLASGEWLATMCLTEPTAGSDLAQIRTTATPDGDGGWRIEGTKIFISGGDHDYTDDILHLVLARTPGAPPGVKGLALFLCPARRADGSPNGVTALRLEEKMGMHASPTCQLAFEGARAELIGAPGEGLARMFTMMNVTRLDVGAEGVGLAEAAMQRAWRYAAERRQGRAPGSAEGSDPICRHGDVQRMLLTQRALVEGCRALVYRTLVELELEGASPLVEFLTPVCKAFCTESAVRVADLAIQIHGGYGYCREYRVEQVLRDARITPIYEGTNGIQAMTLAGRLLRLGEGGCWRAFEADLRSAIGSGESAVASALARALPRWVEATEAVVAMDDPGMAAHDYLRLTGRMALGAAWARLAGAAEASPRPERARAVADFVARWLLPDTEWLAAMVAGMGSHPRPAETVFESD